MRPRGIVIACGDGNFYVTSLKWASWTNAAATATGAGHLNDCTPYCAAGHFHTYPIAVRLSRPKRCSNGRVEYTRFSYRFAKLRPPAPARASDTVTTPFVSGVRCP